MSEERIPENRQPAGPSTVSGPGRMATLLFYFCGVLVPLGTWLFELSTGSCASILFDPMPTFVHGALILLVPVTNWLVWRAADRGYVDDPGRLGLLSGLATGVALFYTILFLPLTPLGVVAVIAYGIGFFLLAPLFSLVGAIASRYRLKRVVEEQGQRLPRFWLGLGLALLVLVAVELPGTVTRVGLAWTGDGSPSGIRLLRAVGNDEVMLRACYERSGMATDMIGFLLAVGDPVTPEEARKIYYRATGRPFNSVAPPPLTGRGRLAPDDEWVFDAEQAGEEVGGRLKGLYLISSQLVCSAHPEAALSYTEWTLAFRNDHNFQQHEARAQIALPPGAVVSRASLWVNGEEREAAFAARGEAREAYEAVVRTSRDPLLVTTSGPDRVLIQCFPVPPDGGVMQIRLGITAPLPLEARQEALVQLPHFRERNFSLKSALQHKVVIDAPGKLESTCDALKEASSGLEGELSDYVLSDPGLLVQAQRDPAVALVWSADPRSEDSAFVSGTLQEQSPEKPSKVIFVVDGSRRMGSAAAEVAEVLAGVPEVEVLFAADEVLELPAAGLAGADYEGGQDGVPALTAALEQLKSEPGAAVVWIHSPQPVELAPTAGLRALLEHGPLLYDFQVGVGPNRVLEALDGLDGVRVAARRGEVGEDLRRLLAGWEHDTLAVDLRQVSSPPPGVETSAHLVRLWAASKAEALRREGRAEEAVKLSVRYQLVTPVSGAVVLESKEQYDEAGLAPVDEGTVPTIPEPETWILICVCLAMLMPIALRQRRTA